MEFTKQRGRDDTPSRVITAEEPNVLGGLSEPKSKRGDPKLPRRPRQTQRKETFYSQL